MAKQASHSDAKRYTDPALRDRIKAEVTAGDKGGKPGQWSARKAQLVAHTYEQQGGGYTQPPDKEQQSLKAWGDEHWTTADGSKAERPGGTTRYLPSQAWESLSDEEKAATNRKKQEGSQRGQQFVPNTSAAAGARKRAAKKMPPMKAPVKKKSVARDGEKTLDKKTAAKKKPASAKRVVS